MIIEGKASRLRPRPLEVARSLALGVNDDAPRLAPDAAPPRPPGGGSGRHRGPAHTPLPRELLRRP